MSDEHFNEPDLSDESPLDALANAARDTTLHETPTEPWAPGGSLGYEVTKQNLTSKQKKVRSVAIAAVITGMVCVVMTSALLGAVFLKVSQELPATLSFGAFISMVATLTLASIASRDGADEKLILAARAFAFAWIPAVLGIAIYAGTTVGGLICLAIALVGIAVFFLIAAVFIRELLFS